MDLDQLIEELTKLREKHGGACRVLWWNWEPDEDFDLDDSENIEVVQFNEPTGDVLLC